MFDESVHPFTSTAVPSRMIEMTMSVFCVEKFFSVVLGVRGLSSWTAFVTEEQEEESLPDRSIIARRHGQYSNSRH